MLYNMTHLDIWFGSGENDSRYRDKSVKLMESVAGGKNVHDYGYGVELATLMGEYTSELRRTILDGLEEIGCEYELKEHPQNEKGRYISITIKK